MLINIALLTVGMLLLLKGGDWLVNGASSLARRYKISELTIGLTIVAFGTSAPELIITLLANINSHDEIALGNIIGSNIFNQFFALGIACLLIPVAIPKNTARIEIQFSLFGAVALLFLANFGLFPESKNVLGRIDGLIMLSFFGLFVFYAFKTMKADEIEDDKTASAATFSLPKTLFFIVFGLAMLIFGGRTVVNSAVDLALALNISEKIIALTIVSVGTSLPELIISITAVFKKKSDIAVGNIIGSSIFNIFFVLSISAVVRPIEYSQVFNQDLYFLIFGTVLLILAMFTGKKKKIDRWEGAIFVLLYLGYLVFLIQRNG